MKLVVCGLLAIKKKREHALAMGIEKEWKWGTKQTENFFEQVDKALENFGNPSLSVWEKFISFYEEKTNPKPERNQRDPPALPHRVALIRQVLCRCSPADVSGEKPAAPRSSGEHIGPCVWICLSSGRPVTDLALSTCLKSHWGFILAWV